MSTSSMISRMLPPIMRHRKRAEPPTLSDEQLDKLLAGLCSYPDDASAKDARISDQNIQDITIYLKSLDEKTSRAGQAAWHLRPRTYAILRTINRLSLMDTFIEKGQNDFLIPWNEKTLPMSLFEKEPDDCTRETFFRVQHFYLTKFNVKEVETEGGEHQSLGVSGDNYFKKIRLLGQGGFGGVDEVRSCLSLKSYARKRVSRGRHSEHNRRTQEALIQELESLKLLTRSRAHRHLVSIIGSYTDSEYIAYLMQPVAKGNLEQFLSHPMTQKTKTRLRHFYGCLAGAIQHLHRNKIRHRDLKPRNILVSGSEVFISDFGSAFCWAHLPTGNTRHLYPPVTGEYMAPEIAKSEERGEPSDMWSLGAIYLEMTTALLGRRLAELKQHIRKSSQEHKTAMYYYDNLPAVSDWLKRLSAIESGGHDNEPIAWTRELIRRRPDERPSATMLMKDIFESPSFTVFCCFKCHHDFQDVALAHDASAPKTTRKEDATGTMDVVAQLLSPKAGKHLGINKWLGTSWAGVQLEPGFELATKPVGNVEENAKADPAVGLVDTYVEDSSVEDFFDTVEYQSSLPNSSPRHFGYQCADVDPWSEGGRSSPLRSLADVWAASYEDGTASDISTSVDPNTNQSKEDATGVMESSISEWDSVGSSITWDEIGLGITNAPSYRTAHPKNLVDSGLGYLEFDDDSSQPWGESSDRSDNSSEGGFDVPSPPSSKQEENLAGKSLSRIPEAEEPSAAPHHFTGSPPFDEVSDYSDVEDAPDPTYTDPLPSYEDTLNMPAEGPGPHQSSIPGPPSVSQDALGAARPLQVQPPLSVPQGTGTRRDGLPTPSIEAHAPESERTPHHSKLSRANIRALGKEQADRVPRSPKKRDALLGVDPEKLMHDICDMFSTAPSSKMTAQTRRSYDSLLFKMAPQVQIENHIVTACKAGKSQELKYLLGLDRPPASNRSKRIALMRAVQGASLRHNNCVRTLIDAGINVDAVSYTSGKTALHWALENDDFHGYTNLIMLLVDPACGGANPNRHDYNGDYPLTKIFSDSGSAPLGQHRLSALAILLKQANIDVNVAVPGSDNTPLHLAVRRQDSRAVAMLLYKGADVNAKNSAGATPLQVAANQFRGEMGSNHAEVLDLLLRHGAMVDERAGALGRTALHLAAASGTAHAVEVLLKHNASVTLKDTNGLDAMSLAVQHASKLTANENRPEDDRLSDHVDMMQQLNDATECGWPMKEGKCPVQIAIEDGDGNLLKKLLHYKLDLGSRYLGGTVREYAARFENDAAKSLQ